MEGGQRLLANFRGSNAFKMSKLSKSFKGSRTLGVNSEVPRFKGSRASRDIWFQGYQKSKGLRVSRDRGPPRLTGISKVWYFPKSNGFRVQGIKGFLGLHGPRVKGIKTFWVPVNPKVSKVQRA